MATSQRRLILLRHGTPVPEEEDPERPLSAEGQREAAETAEGILKFLGVPSPEVSVAAFHSGKARARQTAEAVVSSLRAAGWVLPDAEVTPGLEPKADPAEAQKWLAETSFNVGVLVGHLPHMGLFASRLVNAPAAAGRLGGHFHPAGGLVLRASATEEGIWQEETIVETGRTWWAPSA